MDKEKKWDFHHWIKELVFKKVGKARKKRNK